MQSRLLFLFVLISLWLVSSSTSGQGQYLAEIITPDTGFCESGVLNIEIKFGDTFEPPFDAKILISHAGGTNRELFVETFYPSAHNNSYIFNSDNFKPKTFDQSIYGYGDIVITIEEARDKNSVYSSDNVAGSTTVTLYKTPSAFTAGEDIATCGLTTLLNATPGTESTSYYWEPAAGASFSESTISNPMFTADEEGTYELSFIQTNGVCSVSDNVSVELRGQPSGTLSTNSEICGTGEAEIDFELQGFTPLTVAYSYGNDTDQFTTADLQHTQTHLLPGETTFQLLTVTDVHGCTSTFTNEPGITATVADILPTAYAGDDRVVCADEITLSAAEPAFGTGTWSGGGSFSDINDKNSVFYPDPFRGEATKTLTWIVQNKHCSASDQITVTFYEQPVQTDVWAGKDTLLYEQKSYILDATPPTFGEGAWSIISGNGLISQPNNPNAEIDQLDFGQTVLRWTLSNGECATVWQEVEISVQSIQHPTGFSPNGDGKNDLLKIPGAEFIENNQLIVFNQQGTVVYKTNNYRNNWSGTKENGEILPDGNYYFVFSGEGVNIKDYLIIKRSMR